MIRWLRLFFLGTLATTSIPLGGKEEKDLEINAAAPSSTSPIVPLGEVQK